MSPTAMKSFSTSEKCDAPPSLLRKCCPYRPTDSAVLPPSWKRITLLVFGMVQNGLCGGLIFGWASIDQSILSQPMEIGGAGLHLDQTTKIFTWATSISMVAALILGALLDYSGPRLASMTACLTISLGFLVFSLSSSMVGFASGAILIGFGGPGIGNCIIHLAQLFPRNQNLAMSCLSGSIAFSFSMFAIFDSLWTDYPDLSFRRLFGGYAVVLLLLALGAAILYPDEPYEELIEDEDESDDDLFEDAEGDLVDEVKPILHISTDLGPERHNHAGHAAPHISFVVEQPLNSYLRDKHRMAERTDSYRASKKSMAEGGPPMSLKDESLWNQLASADYIRAFLVFMVSTFVTNFYVVSLSTELKDRQTFSTGKQHELSRWFTMIMGMGICVSFLVGWLLDTVGLEFCTTITLFFGQMQMVLVIFGSDKESCMLLSFVAYTAFRSFLYPVFIGSLTSRLGFKYFGILLGLGFALSGIVQLLFPKLVNLTQGDCHLMTTDTYEETCDHGKWQQTEIFQLLVLGVMYVVPVLDLRDRTIREMRIREMLLLESPVSSYGSVATTETTP